MFSRRLKTGYFILEGLNSFATVYYFYYLYFFMQKTFGFDNKANLMVAALNGATYAVFAWLGGKFAQRFGYFLALKVGFVLMMLSLAAGLKLGAASAAGQVVVMGFTVLGMCFTWPTLEALVSEGEPAGGVQHMVGIYNVVWAGTAAVANFSGGAMLEHLGTASLFYVPIAIQLTQLVLTFWLEREAKRRRLADLLRPSPAAVRESNAEPAAVGSPLSGSGTSIMAGLSPSGVAEGQPCLRRNGKSFLLMAWLANPCAYIAINTLIAAMPGVARHLQLSTMLAGFCGSVWCFARLAGFVTLWLWSGWHYRFRWLLLAYSLLVATFAVILLAPNLVVLVSAQLLFGSALGLIYYSSLFYSMDSSETKGEHGGIHEAAIGVGNCAGPAVGAAALYYAPQYANSGIVAVTLLLFAGWLGLAAIWRRGKTHQRQPAAVLSGPP